jgi:hypothetical protein
MSEFGDIKRRVGRSLLSVVVAYAIAVQSLLIAVAGFSIPANIGLTNSGLDAPAYALCLHDRSGTAEQPAGTPDHSGCTHCIFCFAGAHHAVIGAVPVFFDRVTLAVVIVPWLVREPGVLRLVRYVIANPRGPPVVA